MSSEIDLAQIKRAAHNSVPLTFKTYTMPHETEIYLDKVLESFLAESGRTSSRSLSPIVFASLPSMQRRPTPNASTSWKRDWT